MLRIVLLLVFCSAHVVHSGTTSPTEPELIETTTEPAEPQTPAVCFLAYDRGNPAPGKNYTIRWFYSVQYGSCLTFWYTGLAGNGNRFLTRKDCEDVCVHPPAEGTTSPTEPELIETTTEPAEPQTPAVCFLAYDRGNPAPGKNYTIRWFYSVQYGSCLRFWYTGLAGNGNRFLTRKDCEDVCVHPPAEDRCRLPKVTGPCLGSLVRWYYDVHVEQCLQFTFTGCQGNYNNFRTRELCQSECQSNQNRASTLSSHPQDRSDDDMCSEGSMDQVSGAGSRLCTEKLLIKAVMRNALASEKQAEVVQQGVAQGVELLRELVAILRGPPRALRINPVHRG